MAPHTPPTPRSSPTRRTTSRVLRDEGVRLLADPSTDDEALLVGLLEPGGARGGPRAVLHPLSGCDPVADLLGVVAPAHWWAVGLVAPATAWPLDAPEAHRSGTFAHLVARNDSSFAALGGPGAEPTTWELEEPGTGRVADLCRRALGLATPPPPPNMGDYVVDLWLGLVVRAALARPGLDWSAVVGLHPGTARAATDPHSPAESPATLAELIRRDGASLDWGTFREACIERDRTPFGELDARAARWLDTGSFARWLAHEAPPWAEVLDLLDALLTPSASDLLWATVSLCGAPEPPARPAEG